MALWMVRAGGHGEHEDLALEQSLAVIGFDRMSDLSPVGSRQEMEELAKQVFAGEKPDRALNWARQLWAFRGRIKEGDLAVLPLKRRAAIAIGKVTGPYQYRPDLPSGARHTRKVEWLRNDLPRTGFDQDLLYSFGAFMTVCQIERNSAEDRIRTMLEGKVPVLPPGPPGPGPEEDGETVDLEAFARDQIRTFISQRFRGHDLQRLVEAVLHAQGYVTKPSAAGADGGVDIVAGKGPLGFDEPRLVVQVKSSDQPQDVKVFRELHGVLPSFGAQQGLLISWGGFTSSVINEARRHFFTIRLWDADDLIDAVCETYDRLPEDLQAELPLKRIWALVLSQEQ